MDEMLDIIDENDKAIGKATFTECHRRKLLHRVVHAIVFRDQRKKEVLVQKRSQKVEGPGRLDFPGGHVKAGQSYIKAMRMEFSEEVLGGRDTVVKFSLLEKFRKTSENCDCIVQAFETIYKGPVFANDEVEESYWVNFEELKLDMKKHPSRYTKSAIMLVDLPK